MSKGFNRKETVQSGVRRMARRELERARVALERISPEGGDEWVHGVRKDFQRLRALARLVRGTLGKHAYHDEDDRLGEAAANLTPLREAAVAIDTIDLVAERIESELSAAQFEQQRQVLRLRREVIAAQWTPRSATVASILVGLKQSELLWSRLKFGGHRFRVLKCGLKRALERGRDAYRAAVRSATTENLHDCRKSTKYVHHMLEMFERCSPESIDRMIKMAGNLGDSLGADHDLARLAEILQADPVAFGGEDTVRTLTHAIEAARREFQHQAFAVGRALYRHSPNGSLCELHVRWRRWRSVGRGKAARKRSSPEQSIDGKQRHVVPI